MTKRAKRAIEKLDTAIDAIEEEFRTGEPGWSYALDSYTPTDEQRRNLQNAAWAVKSELSSRWSARERAVWWTILIVGFIFNSQEGDDWANWENGPWWYWVLVLAIPLAFLAFFYLKAIRPLEQTTKAIREENEPR